VFFVPFVVKKQPLRLGIKTQQQKLTTIPIHQTVLSYSTFPSCTISFINSAQGDQEERISPIKYPYLPMPILKINIFFPCTSRSCGVHNSPN
jgi:hypothetical protein